MYSIIGHQMKPLDGGFNFANKTWQGELKLTGPIVIEVTKILEMFYIILATKASLSPLALSIP